MIRAAVLLAGLLAATPALAYTLLDGPMPSLSGRKATILPPDPRAFAPAPRPDFDVRGPTPREHGGTTVAPGLTNRNTLPMATGNGYAPGSAFSDSLGRGNRRGANELGSTWAPSLHLRMPLP